MLTVDDIKNVSFRRANFGGYKPEDVDAFIDDVEESYQKILDKNESLCNEIESLKGKIRKLQGEDSTIKTLILNAKEIADGTISKAKEKTAELVLRATKESEKIVARAKKEVDFQKEIFDQLKNESVNLRKKLDDVYKEHRKIVSSIPDEIYDVPDEYSAGHVMEEKSEVSEENKTEENKQDNLNCLNISSQEDDSFEEIKGGSDDHSGDSIEDILNGSFHHDSENERTYKDLKFGKDYDISEDESGEGAFSGLFKK